MSEGNGEPEWITHEVLRAGGHVVVDVHGYKVRCVRAAMPFGRGVRVRVLGPVQGGSGFATGGSGRLAAVEFEGYIDGGAIVSELEVRR